MSKIDFCEKDLQVFFEKNKDVVDDNFSIIGDDVKKVLFNNKMCRYQQDFEMEVQIEREALLVAFKDDVYAEMVADTNFFLKIYLSFLNTSKGKKNIEMVFDRLENLYEMMVFMTIDHYFFTENVMIDWLEERFVLYKDCLPKDYALFDFSYYYLSRVKYLLDTLRERLDEIDIDKVINMLNIHAAVSKNIDPYIDKVEQSRYVKQFVHTNTEKDKN